MSIIYGISTPRKLILQGIPKSSGTIIVKEILMHTNTQEASIIGRNSEEQSRRRNKSSSIKKWIKLPIRDVVHGSS